MLRLWYRSPREHSKALVPLHSGFVDRKRFNGACQLVSTAILTRVALPDFDESRSLNADCGDDCAGRHHLRALAFLRSGFFIAPVNNHGLPLCGVVVQIVRRAAAAFRITGESLPIALGMSRGCCLRSLHHRADRFTWAAPPPGHRSARDHRGPLYLR